MGQRYGPTALLSPCSATAAPAGVTTPWMVNNAFRVRDPGMFEWAYTFGNRQRSVSSLPNISITQQTVRNSVLNWYTKLHENNGRKPALAPGLKCCIFTWRNFWDNLRRLLTVCHSSYRHVERHEFKNFLLKSWENSLKKDSYLLTLLGPRKIPNPWRQTEPPEPLSHRAGLRSASVQSHPPHIPGPTTGCVCSSDYKVVSKCRDFYSINRPVLIWDYWRTQPWRGDRLLVFLLYKRSWFIYDVYNLLYGLVSFVLNRLIIPSLLGSHILSSLVPLWSHLAFFIQLQGTMLLWYANQIPQLSPARRASARFCTRKLGFLFACSSGCITRHHSAL